MAVIPVVFDVVTSKVVPLAVPETENIEVGNVIGKVINCAVVFRVANCPH